MLKRNLAKLLIIGVLLTNFLVVPVQVSAQTTCRQCEDDFNSHRLLCLPLLVGAIACIQALQAARLVCVHDCVPDAASPRQEIEHYCQFHPTEPVCAVPSTNGNFCDSSHLNTAIGCVPITFGGFFQGVIRFGFIIGGSIALILMIIGAFQMITSGGNPEGIKKGREQFVAAVSGLIFIVLSTALLRIIGVDILDIPGF